VTGLPALAPSQPSDPQTPARQALDGILVFAGSEEALRMAHSDMERELKDRGREALCRVYQWWLDQLAPGRALDAVVDAQGQRRTPKPQLQTRQLLTLFGTVYVKRTGYGVKGTTSLHPLDAQLNLPPERYSHELRRYVARQASQSSFEETVATLREYTGTAISKRQVEQLAQRAARDFGAFYDLRRQEGAGGCEHSGSVLVLTSDAKGVPMYTCDLRPETRKKAEQQRRKLTTRLTKGEKPHRKRMAVVTAVYTVAPYPRTPEEVFGELSRQPLSDDGPSRPRPQGKRVQASLVESPEQMLEAAFQEALSRDPSRQKTWAAVVDGNETQLDVLKKLARKHTVKLTIALDIIHVLEYCWKAGRAFHSEGSDALEHWVLQRLRRILYGDAGQVAGGMRRSATKRGFSKKRSAPVERCAKYLINHKRYLHYPQYLAAGLPIGTGVIEGTVRHLIKDRMLLTGARWRLPGSEAVLRLRALRSSQDFDEYWHFHEAQEYTRNHQALYANAVVPRTPYTTPPLQVVRAEHALQATAPDSRPSR
jgi:hypothetical protein